MQRNFEQLRDEIRAFFKQPWHFPTPGDVTQGFLEQCREFVAAVQFLTIITIPGSARLFRTSTIAPQFISGSAYFPPVGFIIGVLLSIIPLIFGSVLPPLVVGALLVAGWIVLTGGLHLDGLMDTCDGVLGRSDRNRKLEIMKDSRVGSFGVLGGVCALLLKFAIVSSLNTSMLLPALWIVPTVARWGMVMTVRAFPTARAGGIGNAFRQTVTVPRLIFAALFSLIVALAFGHFVGLLVWMGATLIALIIGAAVTQNLGGLTGDVYGAVAEVTEAVALLLFLLMHTWF